MKQFAMSMGCGVVLGFAPWVVERCQREHERRIPASWQAAQLDQCAQAEAACLAVGQKLGITVTIPPWQAMVLAPVLDPR
jgi:hypothetical protein